MREAVQKEIHTVAQVVEGYEQEVQCTLEVRFNKEDYVVKFTLLPVHGTEELVVQAMGEVYQRACELGRKRLTEVLGDVGKQLDLFDETRVPAGAV